MLSQSVTVIALCNAEWTAMVACTSLTGLYYCVLGMGTRELGVL